MNLPEFEIHFASEVKGTSKELRDALYGLGFRDDGLISQAAVFDSKTNKYYTSCPLIEMHITWDTYDKKEYLEKKADFISLLKKHKDCTGYTHAEIVKPEWDIDIAYRPFDPKVQIEIDHFKPKPSKKFKKWDIHISSHLNSLDPRLETILFSKLGMYYIDVLKKGVRVDRVFTIQGTNHIREGLELFNRLHQFINEAGGMKGAIKFEQTIYRDVYGKPKIVPPVID